jgi:hypothetical protein
MAWFKRESGELDTSGEKTVRTEGLWVKCENCRQIIWKKDVEDNYNVCPKCDKHFRIDARTRLAQLLDDNQYEVFDSNLVSTDPLKFVDLKAYRSRLQTAQNDTGLHDAIINAHGKLNGRAVIVSAMEYSFIGGSMGAVVGEAITRAIEKACDTKTPIVIVSASGGAHDGRRDQPDAAGEDFSRTGPPRRREGPIHFNLDGPNHRRRNGLLRNARRPEYRGTWRTDRLRRPASNRTNDPPKVAGRIPKIRVPA